MLVRAVSERALGALFGSELVADVLLSHLEGLSTQHGAELAKARLESETAPNDQFLAGRARKLGATVPSPKLGKLLLDIRQAIRTDIDQRTSKSHRLNEAQLAADGLCGDGFLVTAEIPAMDTAIDAVFITDDRRPTLRDEHVQRYAELLSELDPTVLVGWYLAGLPWSPESRSALADQMSALPPLFVGPRFNSKPFAENHVHLNGIAGDGFVLSRLLLSPGSAEDRHQAERIRRFRRILAAFIAAWSDDGDTNMSGPRVVALMRACAAGSAESEPATDWGTLASGLSTGNAVVTARWMLWRLASAMVALDLPQAWNWLFVLLWRTYRAQSAKPALRAVVLLAIAEAMVLRRLLLVDGNGLRRFTMGVFHAGLRRSGLSADSEISAREAAHRLFSGLGDKAELKVCTTFFNSPAQTQSFARFADERLRAVSNSDAAWDTAVDSFKRSGQHWHFCAHFNRVTASSRESLWTAARDLRDVLRTAEPWELSPPSMDADLFGLRYAVHPTTLIRGLDVVGDETRIPIERFAPMLRWLRNPKLTHDPSGDSVGLTAPTPRLHLSIHAGEDYAHPLSGLRHVDETVRFCEMRSGDRLGHALALGIPPKEWLRRHGEAWLPLDEHFDNLIWAWHEATTLAGLAIAQRVRPRLAARIARMLPHVWWLPRAEARKAPSWHDLMQLHEAWRLRENCAYKLFGEPGGLQIDDLETEAGVPGLRQIKPELTNPRADTAAGLYVLRARQELNRTDIIGTPSPNQPLQVRVTLAPYGHVTRAQRLLESEGPHAGRYLHDHDDADDLCFMEALQDACLERYARRGLTIEVNPSSNVHVGQLRTHGDHSIYRWDPPLQSDLSPGGRFNRFGLRTQRMPVTINTDDPGILPTTLRLEHHLMHEAAIDRGHTEGMADNWIDTLRLRGLTQFDNAH
ncbi:hypothetical protein DBR12_06030 [Acidovorax sp. HMWF029]|uniref:hypothetical protein n=1 Tax=Acidovorax sp. HMWF029 TaxID=2056863 RepID=UPI000D3B89CD|nr:hypothetical protein [Acidovorax sp. HMWF029]PTT21629.1 hypothetical protein DBR12_06030 [Acidovorax sp. HMWF029]